MVWAMVILGIVIVVGGILGGMGFFGQSDAPNHRGTSPTRFLDWML